MLPTPTLSPSPALSSQHWEYLCLALSAPDWRPFEDLNRDDASLGPSPLAGWAQSRGGRELECWGLGQGGLVSGPATIWWRGKGCPRKTQVFPSDPSPLLRTPGPVPVRASSFLAPEKMGSCVRHMEGCVKCDTECVQARGRRTCWGGGSHSESPLEKEGQASPTPNMHPLGRLAPAPGLSLSLCAVGLSSSYGSQSPPPRPVMLQAFRSLVNTLAPATVTSTLTGAVGKMGLLPHQLGTRPDEDLGPLHSHTAVALCRRQALKASQNAE